MTKREALAAADARVKQAEEEVKRANDELLTARISRQVLRRKTSGVPMRIDLSYSIEERLDPDIRCPK